MSGQVKFWAPVKVTERGHGRMTATVCVGAGMNARVFDMTSYRGDGEDILTFKKRLVVELFGSITEYELEKLEVEG